MKGGMNGSNRMERKGEGRGREVSGGQGQAGDGKGKWGLYIG